MLLHEKQTIDWTI